MTQRSRRRHRRRGGAGAKLLLATGGVVALIAIAAVIITSWVLDVAAKAPSLAACKPIDRGGNSTLYAGDGSKLGVVASDEALTPISIDRVPKELQLATVAIEDQRFYQHGGIDPEGILRAALKDLEAGKAVEGGSTITQQLVRNLCISDPHRNLNRKIIEAKLAIEYSQRHSKRQILGQYLNTASYGTIDGSTAVGVQAASLIYFSKPAWKLTLPQAALLAIGAIKKRALVDRDSEGLVVRPTMHANLACDHRILYGAPAAEFLARIRTLLEEPLSLAL